MSLAGLISLIAPATLPMSPIKDFSDIEPTSKFAIRTHAALNGLLWMPLQFDFVGDLALTCKLANLLLPPVFPKE